MSFKPENYTSVSPYLIVSGAQETINFLAKVFGAEPLRMYRSDDGRIQHGEVRIDDTVLMVSDAIEGWPAVACHVHVYVPNVDSTYGKALEAGAVPVQEPVKKEHDSDKRGGFRDAGGTTWWIGTQVK